MASGVNFGQQQYFGFDPRTIPSNAIWLDAADSNALVLSGSVVTTWRDKSGNGRDATSSGSPTLTTGAQNGLSVITFNGLNQWMTSALSLGSTQPLTLFVVARSATTTGFRSAVSLNAVPGARGNSLMLYLSGSGFWWFSGGTGATDGTTSTLALSTSRYDINANYWRPSFVQMNINGTAYASSTSTPASLTASSTMIVGRAQGGTEYWNGTIGEIIVYADTLSPSQRQQVEGYLADKWGLRANLPASHPYKTAPPAMRLFQPVDVSGGTLLWLDAADATTITGSPVTQWRDKSGRASNAVTGLGSVVSGTAINSRNTLRFGLSTTLNLSNFTMPSTQTSVFYVFRGVTSNTGGGGTGYFIWSRTADNFGVFSGNEQFFSYQNPGAGRSYVAVMGPNGERNWGNLPTTAFANAVNVISTTGISYASSNGLSLPLVGSCNVSNSSTAAATYQIGTTRSCCGDVYTYDLGELVVYDGTAPTSIAQQLEGYLAWKWGVQGSLPTTHPYYRVLPSTPRFAPPQLSGLVLWMDPTDSTTLTLSGSSVTQWRDKSASAATFTAVNANPTYNASLINGLPALDLTNASGFISSTTQNLTASLSLAMVIVVKSGIGGWGSFFTHGGRDLDFAMERNSISSGTTLQFQTANDNAGANLTFTTDQVALYLGTMTTGTSRFFSRFGGGTTSTSTGTNSLTLGTGLKTIRIGRSDVGENCNSFIGEVVYFNRVLSTSERQQVEGYLAWKWGLQASLPSTHPYARFTP